MKTLEHPWPAGAAAPPADDLERYLRKHRLKPPEGLWERFLVWFQNAFESVLVRASVLPDVPVYDNALFPWVGGVEAEWTKIRAELDEVMQRREDMPSFQDIIKEVGTINTDQNWKTFFLMGVGMQCDANAQRCPETMRILRKIPGITTAFFSILSPHKHLPHHRGPYAGVLRLHLGLQVPEPREQVRIRIANRICHWTEGKCLIFDDSYNHEVWNDTDGYRVVLFIDFERPLRFPFNWLNHWLMNLAPLAPFLREAQGKHKAWEKKFYRQ
jgi:aspartyl/asparaginyl beta-hydroxylase (cupin superfamily)